MTEDYMFERCRSLLLSYGCESGNLSYYYDSFGCDFCIRLMKCANGKEEMNAYLGGRKIYSNGRDGVDFGRDGVDLSTNDPTWFDFIDELENREYNRTAVDEPVAEKATIIEMYRRRAGEYKRFLERHSNIGMAVAKKFGTVRKCFDRKSGLLSCIDYDFKFTKGDHELGVFYSREPSHDHVGIFYNNKMVFSYYLVGYGVLGLDFTGEYINNTLWERTLFGLYMSAVEEDNRQT